MKSPLFYSLPPVGQKIPLSVLLRCLAGGAMENHKKPLERFKKYLGSDRLFYLSSGRAALWVALKAFSRLRPGRREVIIPAYSCPSVVSATLKAGLKPVLCDINLDDFGFLHEELVKKLTAETLAVIVVHLYGYPVQLGRIQELCRDNDTYLVEDAAQAFGNEFPDSSGVKLGLAGDVGFFSFGRGKPLNIMHGGLLAAKSGEIYEEAGSIYRGLNGWPGHRNVNFCLSLGLYSLFSNPGLYWLPQMIPFLNLGGTVFEPEFATARGMDTAAVLTALMVDKIDEEKSIRWKNASWYSEHLRDLSGERRAVGGYPYLRYPLWIPGKEKRLKIMDQLVSRGTGATGSYPTPLNELPGLNERLQDKVIYRNAKIMSESIVTLPVHSRVTEADRENIKQIIMRGIHEN